jgi:hypothetical protein
MIDLFYLSISVDCMAAPLVADIGKCEKHEERAVMFLCLRFPK